MRTALASIALGFQAATVHAGEPAAPAQGPGMTWESLRTLPDFSGWWQWVPDDSDIPRSPQGQPLAPPQPLGRAPLRPEVLAPVMEAVLRLQTVTTNRREERSLLDVAANCRPPRFDGFNGTVESNFEVLFTPGRVTILNEQGLVRRAPLGRALPAKSEPLNGGTSVARWEGDTLVIETDGTGLERRSGPVNLGKDMRTVERFRLVAPDTLEVRLHMTAPDALTGPFEKTFTYRRLRDYQFVDASNCDPDDRSFDHVAGRERFDATPPPDLPPPPEG